MQLVISSIDVAIVELEVLGCVVYVVFLSANNWMISFSKDPYLHPRRRHITMFKGITRSPKICKRNEGAATQ